MKKLLIIDALNLFIRNYVVNPSMDRHGNNVGGCIGFIKSLQKITREMQPDEIIIAWDGHGGSQRKKSMNKNYKEGRSPIRFNRRMIALPPKAQEKNKHYQHMMLMEYLNEMPVKQSFVGLVEGLGEMYSVASVPPDIKEEYLKKDNPEKIISYLKGTDWNEKQMWIMLKDIKVRDQYRNTCLTDIFPEWSKYYENIDMV